MPPAPMQDPSMQGDPLMGGQVPQMGNEEMPPMQGDANMPPMQGEEDNPYEADFDAGVDADEENDPKRFIQQLTGKLSQSLRKYNEQLPQPDADLNKYVAGMVVKQATDGLSQEDVTEILDKVKNDEDMEEPSDGSDEPQDDMPQDGPPQNGGGPQPMGPNESLQRKDWSTTISELYDEFIGRKEKTSSQDDPKGNYRTMPTRKPNFK